MRSGQRGLILSSVAKPFPNVPKCQSKAKDLSRNQSQMELELANLQAPLLTEPP